MGAGKTRFEVHLKVQQLSAISLKCKGRWWKMWYHEMSWIYVAVLCIIQQKMKQLFPVTYCHKSTHQAIIPQDKVWYLTILKWSCEWIRCSFLCRLSLAFICHVESGMVLVMFSPPPHLTAWPGQSIVRYSQGLEMLRFTALSQTCGLKHSSGLTDPNMALPCFPKRLWN